MREDDSYTQMEGSGGENFMAAVTSFAVYLAGLFNEATLVLLFFMFLDMITGLMKAWLTKSLDSTLGMAGLIILGVASFFIVHEGLSILENCAQMSLPILPVLYNA